jgi:hypothetical protein
LTELKARLIGVRAGTIEIVDAKVEWQLDSSGEEYLEVTLVLSDPPPGQETWSLDDAFALRQEVRRITDEEFAITESVAIAFAASVRFNEPREDADPGEEPDG